jgi:hypothetical protein
MDFAFRLDVRLIWIDSLSIMQQDRSADGTEKRTKKQLRDERRAANDWRKESMLMEKSLSTRHTQHISDSLNRWQHGHIS